MTTEQVRIQQIHFLKKIEDLLPANTSLVHELADFLEVSTDSAYRRMRGETALSIYEVIQLCEHFKVSFESIQRNDTGIVTFRYTRMNGTLDSFREFLLALLHNLRLISSAKTRYIKYASEDIPVFYNYKYPALSAFKMFYWMKAIMNIDCFEGKKFSTSVIPDEFKEIGLQIAHQFMTIPSIEIWTDTTILSTIKQIQYYRESGQFESDEAYREVCTALRQAIEDIQRQAEQETKLSTQASEAKNFTLYHSDIEIANNCVLVCIGESKNVFLGHHTFNTIDTPNAEYCAETETWLDNIIRKSSLISGVSEKYRFQFFNRMYQEMDRLLAP